MDDKTYNLNQARNESARNARWYEDFRSKIFISTLTLMIPASAVVLGAGPVAGIKLPDTVRWCVAGFMIFGNFIALGSDFSNRRGKQAAVRMIEGIEAELKLDQKFSTYIRPLAYPPI